MGNVQGVESIDFCSHLSSNQYIGAILDVTYILLDVLVCSIAVYFYELCGILTSP